ncbi:MAG TPA: hypothetical protein VIL49_15230 [Capillimicrobium sp.]|jgi:hypothetical protein
MRARPLTLSLALLGALAPAAAAHPLDGAPDCPVLPADNVWNQRVDDLPVAANSDAIVRSIGLDDHLHADFGTRFGIPFTVVGADQPKVRVSFEYAEESDPGPYPIPRDIPIERGSDRHAIVVDRDSCRLYELFAAERRAKGRWHAGSGAIFDLRSNGLRPRGWTSADAAGLPILPGLARWDDARRGSIDHALRFTVERSRRAFVFPARHFASSLTDRDLPPMGLRLRLKASFDIERFGPQSQIVLTALQRYGMILADNGSDWYVSGAPSKHWDDDDLHDLHDVPGSAFEVVRSTR